MNERILQERVLRQRQARQRRVIEYAHWQHPVLSAWELGRLLDLDERTVAHHLRIIDPTTRRAAA